MEENEDMLCLTEYILYNDKLLILYSNKLISRLNLKNVDRYKLVSKEDVIELSLSYLEKDREYNFSIEKFNIEDGDLQKFHNKLYKIFEGV